MATRYALTGDLNDILGGEVSGAHVQVLTNLPERAAVIDSTAKTVNLGAGAATVDQSGKFTAQLIDTSATDLNVTGLQYRIVAEATVKGGRGGRKTWDSGYFSLTAAADVADLDLDQPALVASWRSGFAAEMETLRDEAVEAAARATDASGLDTSDELVETLVTTDTATRAALSATIAGAITDQGGDLFAPKNALRVADLAQPYVIPHRGYPAIMPEGTLDGVRATFAQGWPVMEGGDVQMLADGALVSYHDTTLDRLTTSTGNVSDQTSASWRKLVMDCSAWYGPQFPNDTPPFWSELMSEFGGNSVLVIENKHAGAQVGQVTQKIIDIVDRAGLRESVIFNCFTLTECVTARAAGLESSWNATAAQAQAQAATLVANDISASITDVSTVTDAAITNLVNAGVRVVMGPINRQWERDRFGALGVEGFYSDDPLYFAKRFEDYRRTVVTWPTTGMWGVGMTFVAGYTATARGSFIGTAPNHRWVPGLGPCPIGELCPVANAASNYTIEIPITWDSITASTATGPGISFGVTLDKQWSDTGAVGVGGYIIRVRQNGGINVWRTDNNVVTAIYSGTSTPITVAGSSFTLRIIVTPSSFRITRSDNGFDSGAISDTTYRGGYIYIGTSDAARGQSIGAMKIT